MWNSATSLPTRIIQTLIIIKNSININQRRKVSLCYNVYLIRERERENVTYGACTNRFLAHAAVAVVATTAHAHYRC